MCKLTVVHFRCETKTLSVDTGRTPPLVCAEEAGGNGTRSSPASVSPPAGNVCDTLLEQVLAELEPMLLEY